jgi:hypothetical protein
MADGEAQVHDQSVEVLGKAAGGGGESFLVELRDERLQAVLDVGLADRVIERAPVRLLTQSRSGTLV